MKILKFLALTLAIVAVLILLLLYEGDIPKDVIDARYSSPASQFLTLNELGRIHYRDEGHRRSLPVVLLHGSNASLHTFEPWVEQLEGQYRLITIDLPGHGLTGEIPSRDYSTASMISVIEQVVGQLKIDRFVIGGNSMGGDVALRYTLSHPDKIVGLVLIDASGTAIPADIDKKANSIWGFSLVSKPWFRYIAKNIDPYYLIVQGLGIAYNHSPVVTESLIMRYNDLTLRSGSRSAIIDRSGTRGSEDQPDLTKVEVPTLLMWGKEDAVIPFAFASAFESAIPDVTTAYYDHVGHIPQEEIPVQSAQDISAFLGALNED